jgi:glycine/serine hydroxymethyltransferase
MRQVGALVAEVLRHPADDHALAAVRQKVGDLTARFPLYQWKLDPVRA